MLTFDEIQQFLPILFSHLFSLLTGIVGVVFMLIDYLFQRRISPSTFIRVIGICILFSTLLAWRDEYRLKLQVQKDLTDANHQLAKVKKTIEKPDDKCESIPQAAKDPIPNSDYWTSVQFKKSDGFRFAERKVSSPQTGLPYAYEVMVRTEIEMYPVAIIVEYKGHIAEPFHIDWGYIDTPRIAGSIKKCLYDAQPKSFLLSFQAHWRVNLPIVMIIYAKEPVTITRIKRTKYVESSS